MRGVSDGKLPEPGARYGRLVVVAGLPPADGARHRRVKCRCDCGEEIVTRWSTVKSGDASSCGCILREFRAEIPAGTRFGRLVVIGSNKTVAADGHREYRCRCDCGKESVVAGNNLKQGFSASCGRCGRATTAITVTFRLDRATREGLARIAEARGLKIDRSAFKGEPDRSAALRLVVAEELARMGDPLILARLADR
jgi:hypothetical protein